MRQVFISASGFLIIAAALFYNFSLCPASEIAPGLKFQNQQNTKSELEYYKFDVRTSQSFFYFSGKYPGMGQSRQSGIYYPRSMVTAPKSRTPQEKIGASLTPLLQYPGGTFVFDAVQAGFEFFTYSKSLTTYNYGNFYTGFDFNRSLLGKRLLRTGFFYTF